MHRQSFTPSVKQLVLVGGGHSHLAVLRHFAMHPLPGLAITLVSREIDTPYSGALAACLAGHIDRPEMHIDLRPLAQFAGAQLVQGTVQAIDVAAQTVSLQGRPSIPYDVLSLNTGSAPAHAHIPGAREHALPVKPIDPFLDHWQRLLERVQAELHEPCRLGFIGAGVAGVEIALAMRYRLGRCGASPDLLSFDLFGAAEQLLPGHTARFRRLAAAELARAGIRFHPGSRVTAIEADALQLENGARHALDQAFLFTPAAAPTWPGKAGLATDSKGFIAVNQFLQSTSHANVFAAGDIATMLHAPRPKSGVFAVRQGMPLAQNLRRHLLGEKLKPFHPQRHALILMGTGGSHALAARGSWAAGGALFWRLKRYLDKAFVDKYSRLPAVQEVSGIDPRLQAGTNARKVPAMRCSGCGAKVGADVLAQILRELEPVRHPGLKNPLNVTEDAAIVQVPEGQLLIQSIDSLPALINDPYVFGQIAAHHCLNDIFAMGAKPYFALANVIVPGASERLMAAQLRQVMAGILAVLNAHATALAGGHTTQGEELNVGLVINGLIPPHALLNKTGVQPGDALILTKALGSGALFAADMRRAARSVWIDGAVESMLLSNQPALNCLREHQVRACTDVSGFGLAGHLLEMLQGNNARARLESARLPLLEGALWCLQRGFVSSLQEDNQAHVSPWLETPAKLAPRAAALFDPQTAGGLLAAIPASQAQDCLQALQELHFPATKVGYVLSTDHAEAGIEVL